MSSEFNGSVGCDGFGGSSGFGESGGPDELVLLGWPDVLSLTISGYFLAVLTKNIFKRKYGL